MSRPLPVRGEPALPPWIREKTLRLSDLHALKARMRAGRLSTVCEEARCPNRTECFDHGTATFLIAGDVCTRACGFCHIASGKPAPKGPFYVQVLATKNAAAADDLAKRLKGEGFAADVAVIPGKPGWFRVHVGPFKDRAKAEALAKKIKATDKQIKNVPLVVP